MRRFASIFVAVLALGALLAATAGAAPREKLPVPWVALNGSDGQDVSPAGSNDFDCEPSKRHRHPVVLVHGLAANQSVNWTTMSPYLYNEGYCVFSLTYGTRDSVDFGVYQPGGLRAMGHSAHQLKKYVNKILEATGAQKVDIVGHSEGSLMPNYYVKFLNGAKRVGKYVGVTPLWNGTQLAGIFALDELGQALGFSQIAYDVLAPYCTSCHQFISGSKFLGRMNEGGAAVPGVRYTMIMTRNDELVIPYTSGIMDGAHNVVVQNRCDLDQSEHLSIIYDPVTAGLISNALDPRHKQPVPCTLVLPGVGAPAYP